MNISDSNRHDALWVLALAPPLAVRLYADGPETAGQRLVLLAVALALAYGWALLFARRAGRPLGPGLPAFAIGFVVMLPGPVGWGAAIVALSFGAVFGREIFGGRPVLPPALIGLSFALFSFPEGSFESLDVFGLSPDPLFAATCLAGAVVLTLRGELAWQVAVGAAAGLAAAGVLLGEPEWWTHFGIGAVAAGVLFLAASPEGAARGTAARLLHGALVGALVLVIRLADPDQPDGIVFAALLGGLFAPLLDRALAWRPGHG
ncbi:MAG: RnfABCDGE type electron transport complex subunit D [Rhodospirillales bacterium]|nr:MAG: RnfABCDGE type electron transport complex subunit D [Rhodospirillales bacterium]